MKPKILTYASLLVADAAIVLLILTATENLTLPVWLVPAMAILAYFLSVGAVMRVTTTLEFFASYFAGALLAVLSWDLLSMPPLLMVVTLVATWFALQRIVFFEYFTHSRWIYLEAIVAALNLGLYLWVNTQYDLGWLGWAVPLPPMIYHTAMARQYILEGRKLNYNASKGYRVKLGEKAPGFSLVDHENNTLSLSDFEGQSHVLLIFVRGDWCPHCHMMLRTYQKGVERFKEKDVVILAIGPDPAGVNREMVLKLGLSYRLLSDSFFDAAVLYGIHIEDFDNKAATVYDRPGLALPASFLIDKKGVLRYMSRPDRVGEFLDPNTIFPVLAKLD
jgi:peroxiredoxin